MVAAVLSLQVLESTRPQTLSYMHERAAHTNLLTLALCANELILDITWAAFSGAVWRSCVECAHFFFFFERVALSPNHDDIYESHKSTPPLP